MVMMSALIGCSHGQENPQQTLKEAVVAYNEKLGSLIDESEDSFNRNALENEPV
jgi:hypothetical protein